MKMTIRQKYKAAALTGILSRGLSNLVSVNNGEVWPMVDRQQRAVEFAADLADRMISEDKTFQGPNP